MADANRHILPNGNIFWYSECTPEEFLEDMISKVDSQIAAIKELEKNIQWNIKTASDAANSREG